MSEGPEQHNEPLILWWMPVLALIAPLGYAAWRAMDAEGNALGEAVVGFFWPGVLFYLAAVAVLWGGWKIELE